MPFLKDFSNASTNNKQLNTTEKKLFLINTRNTFSHIARCPVRFQTAVSGHCRPAGSQRRTPRTDVAEAPPLKQQLASTLFTQLGQH